MKYTYYFTDGTTETIEVSQKLAEQLKRMDELEYNNRKEHYHCTDLNTQNDYSIWLESFDSEPTPMDSLLSILPEAIAQLKPAQKEIIKLFYFEQKTQAEIAEIFGITQGAVSQRITTAEKNLKKFLQKT